MKRIVGKEALQKWLNSPREPATTVTEVSIPPSGDAPEEDSRGKITGITYPEYRFTSRSGGVLAD